MALLLAEPALAQEVTIKSGDARENVVIPDNCSCAFEATKIDEKWFFREMGPNKNIGLLIYPQKIEKDGVSDSEVFSSSISLLQRFVKSFNIQNYQYEYLGIAFIINDSIYDGIVALPAATLRELSNRDWAVDDLDNPRGKLPFKEAANRMVVLDFDSFAFNSGRTNTLNRVAADFDGYSLFDAMIEGAYYGANERESLSWSYD